MFRSEALFASLRAQTTIVVVAAAMPVATAAVLAAAAVAAATLASVADEHLDLHAEWCVCTES